MSTGSVSSNMAQHSKLAGDQKFVQDIFLQLIRNPKKADAIYDAIPDSKSGKIVSVDIARFLAPEFETWDGRVRHTPSTSQPAGEYAHKRLLRALKAGKPNSILLITAGGAGSGKTSALRINQSGSLVDDADLVFDNQMRDYTRSCEIVRTAFVCRWKVRLLYVHRPFQEVVPAVAERSLRTGRWNRLKELPEAHIESRVTVLNLLHFWSKHAHFDFSCVVNSNKSSEPLAKTVLSATEAKSFLTNGELAHDNRRKLLREYENEVNTFVEKGPEHLSNVQAAKSNFQDFFRLIG